MSVFFLADIAVAAVVAVSLPLAYSFLRRASLRGLAFVSVVAFALFAAALMFGLNSYLRLLGGVLVSPWPVVYVLAGMAAVESVAAWIGWRWHLKRFPSGPRGEQALQPDASQSVH